MIPKGIVFWSFIFAAISAFMKATQAALMMIMAALLTPIAYANFGILYALQTGMSTLSITGLIEYGIGKLPDSPAEEPRKDLFSLISGAYIIIAMISFVIIFLLAFSIMNEKDILAAGGLAIILGGIVAFGTLQASLQRLEGNQKASLYSGTALTLVSVIGMLVGVWTNGRMDVMFCFAVVGAIIALLILKSRKYTYLCIIPNFQALFKIFRAISPYIVIGILGWLSGYGMNFFIDAQLDSLQVAYFTFLFNIASIGQLVASSMKMSWSPHFFRIFHVDLINTELQTRKFYSFQSLSMGMMGFLCVIILPYAVNAIGGNLIYYANFKLELAFLFIGYIFCIPFWHSQNYYFAANKGDDLC